MLIKFHASCFFEFCLPFQPELAAAKALPICLSRAMNSATWLMSALANGKHQQGQPCQHKNGEITAHTAQKCRLIEATASMHTQAIKQVRSGNRCACNTAADFRKTSKSHIQGSPWALRDARSKSKNGSCAFSNERSGLYGVVEDLQTFRHDVLL